MYFSKSRNSARNTEDMEVQKRTEFRGTLYKNQISVKF